MEFEKGIFRVHERILKAGPSPFKKTFLRGCQFFFLALTALNLLNLFCYHTATIGHGEVLTKAIEEQMKEQFYLKYEQRIEDKRTNFTWAQWLKDYLKENESSSETFVNQLKDYSAQPTLKLNYSDKGEFIFDNQSNLQQAKLMGEIEEAMWNRGPSVIVDASQKNISLVSNDGGLNISVVNPNEQINAILANLSLGNITIDKSKQKTNIGFNEFDLFYLLVVDSQEFCDELRQKLKLGLLMDLDDYPDQQKLARENFAFYYFSKNTGSIHLATNKLREKRQHHGVVSNSTKNILREHGINKHTFVLSLDELTQKKTSLRIFLGSWLRYLRIYDPSVILINQIMYTFHRQQMILIDNSTMESWFWTDGHFRRLHPLIKYDFQGSVPLFALCKMARGILQVLWYAFAFATVSAINGIFIRVSLKCSSLLIFPMITFQNRFTNQRIGHNHQRLIYQSMGDLGAQGALHDRERRSKISLYFAYTLILLMYYLMFLACSNAWTHLCFNSYFSMSLNDAYFFYVTMMELFSFLFFRTRSTLKYLPKYITIANLIFLIYVNSYMYPCQFEALSVLECFSLYVLFAFLNNYEYEAVNEWNLFGTWTPSENNPRCGYHNVLVNAHYSIGFDIFSLGMPLRFRERFTPESHRQNELLQQEFNFGINYDPRPVRQRRQPSQMLQNALAEARAEAEREVQEEQQQRQQQQRQEQQQVDQIEPPIDQNQTVLSQEDVNQSEDAGESRDLLRNQRDNQAVAGGTRAADLVGPDEDEIELQNMV